jgi:hypothetical protein
MAIDHFNTRNASVVPELAEYTYDCPITFGNISVLDTGTNDKHIAWEDLALLPDAIAGKLSEQAFERQVVRGIRALIIIRLSPTIRTLQRYSSI